MPKKRMSINSHSMKEVEKYARFLLREAGADGSLPTPVPEIIECADLIVDQNVDLKKIHDSFISRGLRFLKSALGKLRGIIDLRENVIYIDMSVLPQRQDFIKLHESAHKVLPWQRELYQVLEDSNITLGLHTRELFEQQANQFAADVLFQVDRFEKEAKDLPLGIKSPILLSKRYGASCHAAIRRYVEKNSGFEGYILRPLSALKLPVTIPEKDGKVNRDLLLDIAGRSRKRQIALAKTYGITDYPAPAGGCLLTDKGYSNRLKDLFKHQKDYAVKDLLLLKYGRHFRINPETKIIVGRTQQDNENIEKLYNSAEDTLIEIQKLPGPLALLRHPSQKDSLFLARAICAGYSKAPKNLPVEVTVKTPRKKETIQVIGVSPKDIQHLLI